MNEPYVFPKRIYVSQDSIVRESGEISARILQEKIPLKIQSGEERVIAVYALTEVRTISCQVDKYEAPPEDCL